MKNYYILCLLTAMLLLGYSHAGQAQCMTMTTINGSLATPDGNFTQRLNRNGTGSSCISPKTCDIFATGTFAYKTHTFTNPANFAQCVSVTLNSPCAAGTNENLQSNVYLTSFNPTDICTNYLADPGLSLGIPATAQSFSFEIPANATYVIVVMDVANAGSSCKDYTINIAIPTAPAPGSSNLVVSGPVSCGNAVKVTGTGTGGNTYVFTGPNGYVFSNVFRNTDAQQLIADNIVTPGVYTLNTYNRICQTGQNSVTVGGSACTPSSQQRTSSSNFKNSTTDL